MNQYITGTMIKKLREKHNMTQTELAEKLLLSDKAISKWETGRGYPDISLLEPIAKIFGISVAELLEGNAVNNVNVSANMLNSKFYVCPLCGNIVHSMGEGLIHCHGITLKPQEAQECDAEHEICIEKVEDEYFVYMKHDMSKEHHISFIAALSGDRIQLVKLYPEGNAEARFNMRGVKRLVAYCNKDGLYRLTIMKKK